MKLIHESTHFSRVLLGLKPGLVKCYDFLGSFSSGDQEESYALNFVKILPKFDSNPHPAPPPIEN